MGIDKCAVYYSRKQIQDVFFGKKVIWLSPLSPPHVGVCSSIPEIMRFHALRPTNVRASHQHRNIYHRKYLSSKVFIIEHIYYREN